MKIHHIGIACLDIEDAIEKYSHYHQILWKSQIMSDELQNAKVCMIQTDTGLNVEFISGEQVAKMIKKGINYYHVCYEIDDLEKGIQKYLEKGAMLISEAKPAILFMNRRVAFLYFSYGLVELLEKEKQSIFH